MESFGYILFSACLFCISYIYHYKDIRWRVASLVYLLAALAMLCVFDPLSEHEVMDLLALSGVICALHLAAYLGAKFDLK